jgi:lysophospholipase L1-like esterase
MTPLYKRRTFARVPPPGGKVIVAGDSINDPYNWVGTAADANQCGLMGPIVAGNFGLTLVGAGTASGSRVTAPGSGFTTTGFAGTVTGGGGTGAAFTVGVYGGGVRTLVWSSLGSGYTSAPTLGIPNTAGGTGATALAVVSGGAIVGGNPAGTATSDIARAALAGGTAQAHTGLIDLVSTYATRITAYSPDLVLLCIGMNDFLFADASTTAAGFRTAYNTILAGIAAALPATQVVAVGILPCPGPNIAGVPPWATSAADSMRQLNQQMAESALDHGVPFASMGAFPLSQTRDSIHPNATGHATYAAMITDFLAGRT